MREEFLTTTQAALALGLSPGALVRLITSRKLPAERQSNGRWRVSLIAVHDYLRRRGDLPPEGQPGALFASHHPEATP